MAEITLTKICSGCELKLPIVNFRTINIPSNGKEAPRSTCIDCGRKYAREYSRKNIDRTFDQHLQRSYNITLEDYNLLLEVQNGLCAICRKPEKRLSNASGKYGKRGPRNAEIRRLAVDHDHETGEVRALLCHDCNVAIGLLKHDIKLLKRAVKYISTFSNVTE